MLEINKIHLGDCLELMKEIPDKSIDAIICDLPYGTTACSWDVVIPFDKLWEQYKRIRKDTTPIVLFGSEPFPTYLRMSNIKEYKYDWIWNKKTGLGFLDSKFRPLKSHEIISVFSKGGCSNGSNPKMQYHPQNLIVAHKQNSNSKSNILNSEPHTRKYLNTEYTNYPKSIISYLREVGLHPTQKPVALLEYLIKTYTNKGDLVLDNCSGSGSLAVACHNTHRNFICIEKNEEYYQKSVERLEREQMQLRLF